MVVYPKLRTACSAFPNPDHNRFGRTSPPPGQDEWFQWLRWLRDVEDGKDGDFHPTDSGIDTDYESDSSEGYETSSSREFDPHEDEECAFEAFLGMWGTKYMRIIAHLASGKPSRHKIAYTTLAWFINRLEDIGCECRPEAQHFLDLICSVADDELYEVDAAVHRAVVRRRSE
jgi:hypothetical protein